MPEPIFPVTGVPYPDYVAASARTLPLTSPTAPPLYGIRAATLTLSWTPKSATDVLDFALDPGAWLEDADDILATVSVIVPPQAVPSDLIARWYAPVNGLAVVELAGGQPNSVVSVQVTLTTVKGRRYTQAVSVQINGDTLAAPVASPPTLPNGACIPPNALSLPDGSILTTDAGSPILIA